MSISHGIIVNPAAVALLAAPIVKEVVDLNLVVCYSWHSLD